MPQESITSTDKLAADTDRAENKEIASLPDAKESEEPSTPLSITFGAEETNLPTLAKPKLNVLVKQMKADETLRLQLMAYAGSADESPSSVRRKSLSRALSVREFLMDQGVQSTRIEVRALGNNNDGGMPDRVDAVIQER